MTKLRIADGLSLPLDAVTQSFGVLAKRGAGKSYLASVLAEEMLKAGQQILAIDPTGAWHGLRSSADGKGPGFPVVILGGEHGDVPLEESAGEVIATAVVRHRFPAVLDLSLFRKGQLIRFMVTFAETLYRLNREAVHLFVDEADAVAPQGRTYGGDENRMLGAMEDIVRRGRKRGIGCTLITQRPAVINKNVLTQCESLFALRMVHPKDIDAIGEWVNVHADPGEAQAVIASLPSLPVGTAWFWSPGWMGTLQQIEVRRRETFDSGATPKPGETVRAPRGRAEIDLDALGEQIKATVENAKESDPRELRRRIAELERQLRERPAAEPVRVEVPVLNDGQLERLQLQVAALAEAGARLTGLADELRADIARATTKPVSKMPSPMPRPNPGGATTSGRGVHHTDTLIRGDIRGASDLSGPEQRILDELAELEAIGVPVPDKVQLALFCGYTNARSGGFSEPLGALVKKGLASYPRAGRVSLTDAGRAAAQAPGAVRTTEDLHTRVLGKLDGPRARILRELIAAYPADVDKTELAARLGYGNPRSGGFTEPLGSLRSLGLIHYPAPGRVAALPVLFLE